MGLSNVSLRDQHQLLSGLLQLRDHTMRQAQQLDEAYYAQSAAQTELLERELGRVEDEFQQRHQELNEQYTLALARARQLYEETERQITNDEVAATARASDELTSGVKSARNERTAGRWERKRAWEKQQRQLALTLRQQQQTFDGYQSDLIEIHEAVVEYVQKRGCPETAEPLETSTSGNAADSAAETRDISQELQAARGHLRQLKTIRSALYVDRGFVVLVFLAVAVIVFLVTSLGVQTSVGVAGLSAAACAFIVASVSGWLSSLWARKQTRSLAPEVFSRLNGVAEWIQQARTAARQAIRNEHDRAQRKFEQEMRAMDERARQLRQSAQQTYKTTVAAIEQQSDTRRREAEKRWEIETKSINDRYGPALAALQKQHDDQVSRLKATADENQQRRDQSWRQQWTTIRERWNARLDALLRNAEELEAACQQLFPDPEGFVWSTYRPADSPPPIVRLGQVQVELGAFDKELSQASQLSTLPGGWSVPAVMTLSDRPSLLIKAEDEARDQAAAGLRALMLRLLMAMPPSKVQFTVIDPTGLGQNFSAYMHLADFDEKLIGSRIWTETQHIHQKLADLTKHMEDVIQKYLRNEFPSIQEYNAHAGEVAEPFHVLVIANFPANFSDEAARRLVSIMKSGPRCGVYTLMVVDTKMKMPRNFDLADLEAEATTLVWHDNGFYFADDQQHRWPVRLDDPPGEEATTAAIRALGELSQKAQRVEVPFRTVLPENEEVWEHDSRHELAVPLGRAGATRLQWMRLGKGTSQHVLISGKTGSGKSTMLHAMITNLSMYYSPDEVQFYLIDFKKGVEFKPYATHRLPHARVIAIESEREFGMSVLQKLDMELRRRGDLFRDEGVPTLAAYRAANVVEPMPRLLLVIDEFQEFFVKDDAISQNAALILDRLVRQGRAFGIHVLLGSQTLAGAYSLARSTLGQMAVRIALQCSAADAHLILSEDNEAARLLRRPGEAIYNDANGMFEGNHPFQVVWLSDEEKADCLNRIRTMADRRGLALDPPVVFEGNAAADIASNGLLRRAIESPPSGDIPLAPRAWLGESIAIKEPPAIVFHRRGGSNVLLVGQHAETAQNLLASCLFSLAAFSPRGDQPTERSASRTSPVAASSPSSRFIWVHSGSDVAAVQQWQSWGEQLPCGCEVVSGRAIGPTMTQLSAELQRRQEEGDDTAAPIFLLVADAGQIRELQRADDDFGFRSFSDEEAASPSQRWAELLRSGPLVGIHTIVWCASYHHVSRCFERQLLAEMDIRVLLQMSATDSANIMGNADAARLGPHRALLFHEQSGTCEKFRPYGKLPPTWCDWACQTLRRRTATPSESEDA